MGVKAQWTELLLTVGVVDEGHILRAGRDMVRGRSKVGTNREVVDPSLFRRDRDVLLKGLTTDTIKYTSFL